jgi:hypothetical protein
MGLLKTAATVAVASAVHGQVQRRQQARWAAQDQASTAGMPTMPPQPYGMPTMPAQPSYGTSASSATMDQQLAQLAQLGDLKKAGILSEAEFQQQKTRILQG